jgi:methionyl-tRNA formyltransferase
VSLTRPLRREDGRLDVWLTASELERQVRAYQPWPGSFLETAAGRLVVWGATPDGASVRRCPARSGPARSSGSRRAGGWLRLDEVQPAGGRRMPGDAWLRGRPAIAGTQIA